MILFQAFVAGGGHASTMAPGSRKYISADGGDAVVLFRVVSAGCRSIHVTPGEHWTPQACPKRRNHDQPVASILDIIYLIKLQLVSVVLQSVASDSMRRPSGVGWEVRSSHPSHLTTHPLILSLHAELPSWPGLRVMRPSETDKPRIRHRTILQPWFSFPMRIPGASPLRAIIRNHITVSTRAPKRHCPTPTPATPPDENQMLFDNLT